MTMEISYFVSGNRRVDAETIEDEGLIGATLEAMIARAYLQGARDIHLDPHTRQEWGLPHWASNQAGAFAYAAAESELTADDLYRISDVCYGVPPAAKMCWPGSAHDEGDCGVSDVAHAAAALAVEATAPLRAWQFEDCGWLLTSALIDDAAIILAQRGGK
ncbi:MAG: hypothetical protein KGL39_29380 [Patescibacteria group bacterium]|nr:hypothetical protein [Patescibacteria group bacterium]